MLGLSRWVFALFVFALFGMTANATDRLETLQLNWFHDPTFAGEYSLTNSSLLQPSAGLRLRVQEGGPNIFPVAEVKSGRVTFAVVGADIFLKTVSEDISKSGASDIQVIFVDFQRNPVGWVLHPDAASKLGLSTSAAANSTPAALNDWLFRQINARRLMVGDKRGTETTAMWIAWKQQRHLSNDIKVIPVGFDSGIVLSAPAMIYPVYMNEEPYLLANKVGRPVLVFDPGADGIEAYGNVIIAKKSLSAAIVRQLQVELRLAWISTRTNPAAANDLVSKFYKGAPRGTVKNQILKTLDFVFYRTGSPGTSDLGKGGRWDKTLAQLQRAGIISPKLNLTTLRNYVISP